MTVGEIIKRYRIENRLSQREFAARCGDITSGYISMLERGVNPYSGKPIIPSIDKLTLIARAMGMTLHQLIETAEDMTVYLGDDSSNESIPTIAPVTKEWQALSEVFHRMPTADQKKILDMIRIMYPEYYEGGDESDA